MNKFVLIGVLLLSSWAVIAQSEADTIRINGDKIIPELNHLLSVPQMPILPGIQQTVFPLYKPLVTFYNSASFTPETNPFNLDFDFQEYQQFPLNNNFAVRLNKRDETYQGMGAVYVAQASLAWKAGKRFMIIGGTFLNKQITPLNLSPVISYGINSSIQYSITKKIYLNIYGTYLNKNPEDPFTLVNPLFTQTKVGSNITFEKDESRKIGIGMDHFYNVSTEEWQPVYGTKITYKFTGR